MRKTGRSAERLSRIKASGVRRLLELSQHVPGVISLGLGEPDFEPPKHVLEAAKQAIMEGRTDYAPSRGVPALREALARKFKREYNLDFNPEGEILVTVGAVEAVALSLLALVNPGDEVLMPNPGFVCYASAVLIAGGTPVSMPMYKENGFKPDFDAVTSLVTKKSRVIIINSPNNPTGSVLTYDEIVKLGKLAADNDLTVVSDEVYEKIVYDGAKHYCLAAFPNMRERTIVVNSFSKTYAMTGFRVGCALGPADLISAMLLLHQHMIACVSSPAQHAAVEALEGSQMPVSRMVSEFDKRRRFIYKRLGEIDGFDCPLPQGAFYVFPSFSGFEGSSNELSEFLLSKAKVIVTPGSAFGSCGEGFVRLSYATSHEKISEALNRIEKVAMHM